MTPSRPTRRSRHRETLCREFLPPASAPETPLWPAPIGDDLCQTYSFDGRHSSDSRTPSAWRGSEIETRHCAPLARRRPNELALASSGQPTGSQVSQGSHTSQVPSHDMQVPSQPSHGSHVSHGSQISQVPSHDMQVPSQPSHGWHVSHGSQISHVPSHDAQHAAAGVLVSGNSDSPTNAAPPTDATVALKNSRLVGASS